MSELKDVNEGCFSLDFSNKKSEFLFTTAHHGLYAFQTGKKWSIYILYSNENISLRNQFWFKI